MMISGSKSINNTGNQIRVKISCRGGVGWTGWWGNICETSDCVQAVDKAHPYSIHCRQYGLRDGSK